MNKESSERTWLINFRKAMKLTQSDVAESADISRPYYTMIESGSSTPSPKVAQNIGNILDFDWTYFFTSECNYKSHLNKEKVTKNINITS